METIQDFKRVLRLNKLPKYELLDSKSQEKIKDYKDNYEKLITPILPENFCVVHHREVAEFLNLYTPGYEVYREDLDLYSHFPRIISGHCSRRIYEGYTEMTIQEFRKYLENLDVREKLIKMVESLVW